MQHLLKLHSLKFTECMSQTSVFLSLKLDVFFQWARCHADAFAFYKIWVYVMVKYVKPV